MVSPITLLHLTLSDLGKYKAMDILASAKKFRFCSTLQF